MFKGLKPIVYRGREVWPLIEGGKGVSATNHASAGAWAAAGGIGTVSAVNADSYDPTGKIIPQVYASSTRRERHEELIKYGIDGGVAQVQRAWEISGGKGAININVLWEMGGAQQILHGILEKTKGMVSGVTCGAGMPYKLSEIAASYGVHYLPIISSGRAFRAVAPTRAERRARKSTTAARSSHVLATSAIPRLPTEGSPAARHSTRR